MFPDGPDDNSVLSLPGMSELLQGEITIQTNEHFDEQDTEYLRRTSEHQNDNEDAFANETSNGFAVLHDDADVQHTSLFLGDDDSYDAGSGNIDPQLLAHPNVSASFDLNASNTVQSNGPLHNDGPTSSVSGPFFYHSTPESNLSSLECYVSVPASAIDPSLGASGVIHSQPSPYSDTATYSSTNGNQSAINAILNHPTLFKSEAHDNSHGPGYFSPYDVNYSRTAPATAIGASSSFGSSENHSGDEKGWPRDIETISKSFIPLDKLLESHTNGDQAQDENVSVAPKSLQPFRGVHQFGKASWGHLQSPSAETGVSLGPASNGDTISHGIARSSYKSPYGQFPAHGSDAPTIHSLGPAFARTDPESNVPQASASSTHVNALPSAYQLAPAMKSSAASKLEELPSDNDEEKGPKTRAQNLIRHGSNDIIIDYLQDQDRVAPALSRKLKYSNVGSAMAAFNHLPPSDFVPPHDPSKPTTDEEQCAYVLMMLDAALDVSMPEDNQGTIKNWKQSSISHRTRIELSLWRVLELLLQYHSGPGFVGFRPRRRNRFVGDKYPTFAEHVDQICNIFRVQKTACRSLIHEDNLITIVDDPDKYRERTRNNHRINHMKRTIYSENRVLADASRRVSQANAPEALDHLMQLAASPSKGPSMRKKPIKRPDDDEDQKPPAALKRKRGPKAAVDGNFIIGSPEPRKPKAKKPKPSSGDRNDESNTSVVKSVPVSEEAPVVNEAPQAKTVAPVPGKRGRARKTPAPDAA